MVRAIVCARFESRERERQTDRQTETETENEWGWGERWGHTKRDRQTWNYVDNLPCRPLTVSLPSRSCCLPLPRLACLRSLALSLSLSLSLSLAVSSRYLVLAGCQVQGGYCETGTRQAKSGQCDRTVRC